MLNADFIKFNEFNFSSIITENKDIKNAPPNSINDNRSVNDNNDSIPPTTGTVLSKNIANTKNNAITKTIIKNGINNIEDTPIIFPKYENTELNSVNKSVSPLFIRFLKSKNCQERIIKDNNVLIINNPKKEIKRFGSKDCFVREYAIKLL